LHLEESLPPEPIAREMGVGKSTLSKWVRLYRDQGEAATAEPSEAESSGGGEDESR
jgi:transposase-like protein